MDKQLSKRAYVKLVKRSRLQHFSVAPTESVHSDGKDS